MIGRLLRFALQQRFITIVMTLAVIAFGVYCFRQLKVEAYPDISDTQVVIITTYPGQAAEEMEQQITIPIERAMNSVPNLIARRSRTIFGLSIVELTFTYETNDYFARQVVLERLRDADLPDGVTPEIAPLTTPIGEMYRYRLEGSGRSELEIRELQDWVVGPRILQVSGVADVTPFGGLVKQFQVEVSPPALAKYGLTISQVVTAIQANNRNAGGAILDSDQQSMVIRGVGRIKGIPDIENIVLVAVKGVPVLVKDIGTVKIGSALPTGIFGWNEKQGGVEGIVLLRRGENPSEVLKSLAVAIAELNTERLPKGVQIVPLYDRTDLVSSTLKTVSRTLLEGFTVVVLVLVFFLGSPRAAILTALTIPLSLLFAFICMYLYGVPANLLSLGALDFGVVVDGTLVMVEHIVRNLSKNGKLERPGHPFDVIREAALEVERPIFFSLFILIAAYLPLFTLERVERRLFTPMAFTVCAALLGSLLFALTLIPVLATYLFQKDFKGWDNPLLNWLVERYEGLLRILLKQPVVVAASSVLIIIASIFMGARLGSEFLPTLDEGVIWVRANLPPGTSLAKSARVANDMRALIRKHPEVLLVASQTGRNDSGTDPFGPNRNELLLTLKPYDTWPAGKTKTDLVAELRAELNREIPGIQLNFTQPIIDTVTESVTGSSADLAVILRGSDLTELRGLAGKTLDMLRKVPGSADSSIEQEADQPGLRIQIDRSKTARYGLNVDDLAKTIESALGGVAVSSVFENDRKFDLAVRYAPEYRSDTARLGQMLIRTADGGQVPLAQLANIEVVDGPSIILRRENQRAIAVRTNIVGRDQGGFVIDAQKRFLREVPLPPGYQVVWGGQFENLDRARQRLYFIIPVTIAIIFALLFFAFNSTSSAFLVLLNVPFSMVGGILLLYLRGINLSVSAAVGFISLFGVAVMSGVLYISEISRRRTEDDVPLLEAVILGAKYQLRPRLILILVALLGMVPAARAVGIGSDVQRPLATVVVGGLASTLFLTLLALPSLYYLVERRKEAK
ncbi:efflux RND transporter permease subunit [Bryobacter aggregatus]|uniref:efflux RND transporter permease subunit n=1 Tax=Bryobacter aggregatus TaxID=360054 RepID=UPI0004E0E815|nr:CusA/CzcA family heavy metal efflux RND transporter [Bryobacter aggregatus]